MRNLALQGPAAFRNPRELHTEGERQGRVTPQRTAAPVHHGAISPGIHFRAEELHRGHAGGVGAAVGATAKRITRVAEAVSQLPARFGDPASAGAMCKFGVGLIFMFHVL